MLLRTNSYETKTLLTYLNGGVKEKWKRNILVLWINPHMPISSQVWARLKAGGRDSVLLFPMVTEAEPQVLVLSQGHQQKPGSETGKQGSSQHSVYVCWHSKGGPNSQHCNRLLY